MLANRKTRAALLGVALACFAGSAPAQIIAWAIVLGYAQQVFTRLVDQRAQTVLDDVGGGGNRPPAQPAAPPTVTPPTNGANP